MTTSVSAPTGVSSSAISGFRDLTGQKFGKLTVTRFVGMTPSKDCKWECTCECGNTTEATSSLLRRKEKRTCGCGKPKKIDLTGKVFGLLTVTRQSEKRCEDRPGSAVWECKCSCGKTVDIESSLLRKGKRISCGCTPKGELRLLGARFGKLLVIGFAGRNHRSDLSWKCKCDCGNLLELNTGDLKIKGDCGCVKAARKEKEERYRTIKEIGNRYGKLLVVGKINDDDDLWVCRCDCGREIDVEENELQRVESCGCTEAEKLKAEFIGRRFGKLIAEKVKKPNSDFTSALEILCRCDCGGEVLADTDFLQKGESLSCGCTEKEPIVYVIKSEDWIKVGYSSNFIHRNGSLITMVPFDAEALCMLPGGSTDIESNIHDALRCMHTHGEWFRYDQELIDEVMLATDASDLLHRVSKLYGDESKCL